MEALWWLFSSCPKVEAVLCRDFSLSTSLGEQNISGLSGYGFSCFTESRTVGVDVLAEIKCDFVDESRSAVIHRQVPALFPRLLHRLSLALLRKLLHPFFLAVLLTLTRNDKSQDFFVGARLERVSSSFNSRPSEGKQP